MIILDGIVRSEQHCTIRPTDDRQLDFSFTVTSGRQSISISWVQPPYYSATFFRQRDKVNQSDVIGRVDRIGDCWVGRRLQICLWPPTSLSGDRNVPARPVREEEHTLPVLNVNGWCDVFGREFRSLDTRAKAICIQREQVAYDELKTLWGEVFDNVKALCVADMAERLGGSAYRSALLFAYETMITCVDTHMTQQTSPSFRP